MQISKLNVTLCTMVVCWSVACVQGSEDTPAQAAAKAALLEKMQAADAASAPTNTLPSAPADQSADTPAQAAAKAALLEKIRAADAAAQSGSTPSPTAPNSSTSGSVLAKHWTSFWTSLNSPGSAPASRANIPGSAASVTDTPAQAAAKAAVLKRIQEADGSAPVPAPVVVNSTGVTSPTDNSGLSPAAQEEAQRVALAQAQAQAEAQRLAAKEAAKAQAEAAAEAKKEAKAQAEAQRKADREAARAKAEAEATAKKAAEAQAEAQAKADREAAQAKADAEAAAKKQAEAQAAAQKKLDHDIAVAKAEADKAAKKEAAAQAEAQKKADEQAAKVKKAAEEQAAAEKKAADDKAQAAQAAAAKLAAANNPGNDLGFKPILAPPLPISADKQARLDTLLGQYKADQISPEEYHKQRAAILAEP